MANNKMAWLHKNGVSQLYLNIGQGWLPYTSFPSLAKPDYQIPGGSKGYATYQILLKAGWQLMSTQSVQSELNIVSD